MRRRPRAAAIAGIEPAVELRRLRMRQAAGRHFADVVIGVSFDAAVGQGHAAADAVERAVQSALPEADVVVHVEPRERPRGVRERAHAAALGVPRVREVHNVSVVVASTPAPSSRCTSSCRATSRSTRRTTIAEAGRAGDPRRRCRRSTSVQTHLEPLAEEARGEAAGRRRRDARLVARIVREATGAAPLELRFLHTDDGLVAFLTLAARRRTRARRRARARRAESRSSIRRERPEIADVIVHTEPP